VDTSGNQGTASITVNVRNSAPVISSIVANSISSSTETITWTTDEAATSTVSFGLTTGYGSASSSAAWVTSHSITLIGLTASTTYDFDVSSTDAEGNTATSSNQTFTTAAYNYYVDSVHGSDANAGTSPALAFQNITALPTITAGQSVGLANGSHWRQQLTINTANVTVAGYGSGALPILDASDVIPNASFTKTSGYTNVYNIAATTFIEGGQAAWVNMWETGGTGDSSTGTFLTNETSASAVDSTACSYYIPTMTTSLMPTSEPIYIHSCDSSSPIANGYTYEFANRAAGLYMNGYGGQVFNIEARKSAYNDGPIELEGDGNSYLASGVIARDGGKHTMLATGGSTVENSTLIDSYYGSSSGNLLVFFDGTGSSLPIVANNNIFQEDQSTPGATNSAIIAHTASGSLGTVTVNGNWFIAKSGTNFNGMIFANTGAVSANADYSSQLANFLNAQQTFTLTNSQLVSNFNPNAPIETNANNVTVSVNGTSICSSKLQNGLFYTSNTGDTFSLSNDLLYVEPPSSNTPAAFRIGVAVNLSINGTDFGATASTYYYVYNLYGTGSTYGIAPGNVEIGGAALLALSR
jgi:hypothetical protein